MEFLFPCYRITKFHSLHPKKLLEQTLILILLDENFGYCQGNVKFSDACIIACTSNQLNAQEFLFRNFSLRIHSSGSNEM